MSDWLHHLPVVPMALLVFGATYLVTGGVYGVVMALAVGHWARAFKSISPGVLPPLADLHCGHTSRMTSVCC
jgi:hypothetical protein